MQKRECKKQESKKQTSRECAKTGIHDRDPEKTGLRKTNAAKTGIQKHETWKTRTRKQVSSKNRDSKHESRKKQESENRYPVKTVMRIKESRENRNPETGIPKTGIQKQECRQNRMQNREANEPLIWSRNSHSKCTPFPKAYWNPGPPHLVVVRNNANVQQARK